MLVYGDRSKDIVVSAGDTIVVSGTSNFVDINGSVIRPMNYEYLESDNYKKLIEFALGLNHNSEPENLTATLEYNGRVYSENVELSERLNKGKLLEIFVGNSVNINDKDLFIDGSGASNGYYKVSGEKLSEFWRK